MNHNSLLSYKYLQYAFWSLIFIKMIWRVLEFLKVSHSVVRCGKLLARSLVRCGRLLARSFSNFSFTIILWDRNSFIIVAVCVWGFLFVFFKALSVFSIFIMTAVNKGFSFSNGGMEFCQRLYAYVGHVSFTG